MISVVACRSDLFEDLVARAVRECGFRVRCARTSDQAEYLVKANGPESCLVVIEADLLPEGPPGETWERFIRRWPQLPLVVTALGRVEPPMREMIRERNGVLLEDPFDADAVRRAAVQACTSGAGEPRALRPPLGRSDTG